MMCSAVCLTLRFTLQDVVQLATGEDELPSVPQTMPQTRKAELEEAIAV